MSAKNLQEARLIQSLENDLRYSTTWPNPSSRVSKVEQNGENANNKMVSFQHFFYNEIWVI